MHLGREVMGTRAMPVWAMPAGTERRKKKNAHRQLLGKLVVVGEGTKRMVSPALFADIIRRHQPASACMELVGSRPLQGLSSTFRFGKSVGLIEGCIAALQIPVAHVTPQVWRRHFGLIGRDKELSRAKAISLWPDLASIYFSRKKDHGKAEAALIALWAVRVAVAASGSEAA